MILFYWILGKKLNKFKLLRFFLILIGFISIVTIVLIIYGYEWKKIIYTQRLFMEKLSLNYILYEIFNPKLLLYFIFLLPIIYIMIKEKEKIMQVFNNFNLSIKNAGILLLFLHTVVLLSLYLFSSRSIVRAPRFIFPLYTVIPFLVALIYDRLAKNHKIAAIVFVGFLIGINLQMYLFVKHQDIYKPIQYLAINKTVNSYEPLIDYLLKKKIYYIYSPYWVGFPIVFNSGEKIISVEGRSRVIEYIKKIDREKRVAFVFHHKIRHWQEFEVLLKRGKFFFSKEKVRNFLVYYNLEIEKLRNSKAWKQIVRILLLP